MTDDTAPPNGVTDSNSTARKDDAPASGEPTREELAAANEQLRERVADLEAALADVQAAVADGSDNTTAESTAATGGAADTSETETASDPQLVTSGGQPTKVIGKLDDDQGIGVLGEATATSTTTYGVQGLTQSSDADAAGVRASASNGALGIDAEAVDNYAIRASTTGESAIYAKTDGSFYNAFEGINTSSSGPAWGVRGDTSSENSDAYGVKGNANSTSSSASPKGVGGETDASGDGAAGVEGVAAASSGVIYGVKGETNSSDGYGLYTPDDASVGGSVSVSKTGVSAYLANGDQTVGTDTDTTVAFNETAADHFNGMDTSTGVYTVQEAGDYHVSFVIDWSSTFSAGIAIIYDLEINGDSSQQGLSADTTTSASGQQVCRTFSRTVFGLSSGDTIEVVVNQNSGSQKDIYGFGDAQETYMTIHKVG